MIDDIRPRVDGGRLPAKAALGDFVPVTATAFIDGHDLVRCELRHRQQGQRPWVVEPMTMQPDDRWRGGFVATDLGRHEFVVRAAADRWGTWARDLVARAEALEDISAELAVGSDLAGEAATRARGKNRVALRAVAEVLSGARRGLESDVSGDLGVDIGGKTVAALVASEDVADLVWHHRPPTGTVDAPKLAVFVDPVRARFSTWYEMFPRSAADGDRHGTFADVERRLDYVARLGADVLYLPPVHPIGLTDRKGRRGVAGAGAGDPGSPWAIGATAGGHTAIHPELGTVDDFEKLVHAAGQRGIDIALDLAFQCSPDHPWVDEHPDWFRHRPDGSIRFAENPPKKYQDIIPLDFESADWRGLWGALLDVVRFWIDRGVRLFRVDNPHTKPLAFWEWLIGSVKDDDPGVIFLSEAFTRPSVMYRLAKVGFSQSYTYFTWRTNKWEIESYLHELVDTGVADYFRPNFWPNTPDILPEHLQTGLASTFMARLVLAATLASNYGIYGPAFELREHVPLRPGSEEYEDSEKYTVRHWDLDRSDSLADFVARMNRIRHDHPALHHNHTLRFHAVDNDQLIAYSKSHLVENGSYLGQGPAHPPQSPDVILVVVNLDPSHPQSGWVQLDLGAMGMDAERPFTVHELLTDARYEWNGPRNFVKLDPDVVPAHVFRVGVESTGAGAAP
ncbi:MAG: alpha-1,4-glucan--maltose-1-phosphate maltosyltransferase [Acidimicrobiales bacterium]